jgi:hypothetical protein
VTVFEPEKAKAAQPEKVYGADQAAAAHLAVRMLAGVCDGASALDDRGFNKFDAPFGHSLANQAFLSAKQIGIAMRLAIKYQRQLPAELVATVKGLER